MSKSKVREHRLSNGLTLLVEPDHGVRSVSFTLMTPAGVIHEPTDRLGLSNLTTAMTTRGAGANNSRQLMQRQDGLGLQRSEATEIAHSSYSVATLADHFSQALELTADIVRRPHLPEDQLEWCQAGVIQEIEAIEDDPSQKLFLALRERSLPAPFGRPVLGTRESVENTTIDDIAQFHRSRYEPSGSVLGVCGAVEFEAVVAETERLFADWSGHPSPNESIAEPVATMPRQHLESEKVQTHLGIAMESVPYDHEDFFNAHAVANILSGGMSSRLWTEIREKRGLCYSVSASYVPLKTLGLMLAHAATTSAERAAETLELMMTEIRRLGDGISTSEVDRVRAELKSSLVMQQESTAARASVLARHWYHLGRVRTMEETTRAIDALSPSGILQYLECHPLREISVLTLGPKEVEVLA